MEFVDEEDDMASVHDKNAILMGNEEFNIWCYAADFNHEALTNWLEWWISNIEIDDKLGFFLVGFGWIWWESRLEFRKFKDFLLILMWASSTEIQILSSKFEAIVTQSNWRISSQILKNL